MIQSWTLAQVAQIVNGQLLDGAQAERTVNSVSIDTRTLTVGSLYVAIVGERLDGHSYVSQAEQTGAAAALVQQPVENASLPQIVVADTQAALGLLGAANRQGFSGTVLALTGSCGKTSVKEMLRSVLAQQGKTMATAGNYNNALGTPLTLLNIEAADEFAVIELGTSSPGEIAYIANLTKPDIALITNAAEAHLQDLKSIEGVAQEKGAILDPLPADGIAVLNADDAFFEVWYQRATEHKNRRVVSFGLTNPEADVFASDIESTDSGMAFTLHASGQQVPLKIQFWGRHQVNNACVAAAAALSCGLLLDRVVEGLQNAHPYDSRGLRFALKNNVTLIDETYNANPKATLASIDQLMDFHGRRVFVFGDMLELGEVSQSRHESVGQYAREQGVDVFVGHGPMAKFACEAFGASHHFDDKAQLLNWLENDLAEHPERPQAVLVKGSKGMKMIELIQALVGSTVSGEN